MDTKKSTRLAEPPEAKLFGFIDRAVIREGTLPLKTYQSMAIQNKCNYVIPVPEGIRVIYYKDVNLKHIICNSFFDDIYDTTKPLKL